jgi:hypothetical protein
VFRTTAALLCALAVAVVAAMPAAADGGPDRARFAAPPSDSRPTILSVEADGVRLIVHAARVSYSRVIELEAMPR